MCAIYGINWDVVLEYMEHPDAPMNLVAQCIIAEASRSAQRAYLAQFN